jgi:hypothetical protein
MAIPVNRQKLATRARVFLRRKAEEIFFSHINLSLIPEHLTNKPTYADGL